MDAEQLPVRVGHENQAEVVRLGLELQRERDKREILRAVWGSGGLMALGLAALAFIQCQRVQPAQGVTVNFGAGAVEQAAKVAEQSYASDPAMGGDVGERKSARLVPHQPLPHQATKPCRGSTSTLYGSCWVETSKTAPCPPDQYQDGDRCCFPVAADPNVPVGARE